ncbi:19763_t:CDS:2 [Entrophospora sp. SA101]|nr:19763_t:CDS:2 [Entrophospora sp. SA101]
MYNQEIRKRRKNDGERRGINDAAQNELSEIKKVQEESSKIIAELEDKISKFKKIQEESLQAIIEKIKKFQEASSETIVKLEDEILDLKKIQEASLQVITKFEDISTTQVSKPEVITAKPTEIPKNPEIHTKIYESINKPEESFKLRVKQARMSTFIQPTTDTTDYQIKKRKKKLKDDHVLNKLVENNINNLRQELKMSMELDERSKYMARSLSIQKNII